MNTLPVYVSVAFGLTMLLTFFLLLNVLRQRVSQPQLLTMAGLLMLWCLLVSSLALSGFFQVANARPPRLFFLIGPPLLLLVGLFSRKRSRALFQTLPLQRLTLIHLVRIPVELVLLWLFFGKLVPVEMTFEGRNFDILAGLSAPLVAWLGFTGGRVNYRLLLIWNLLCVGLLLNIVGTAVLSAPLPFQRFGFDQPNVGIGRFPFVLLPGFIVPVVLWSHVVAIRQLLTIRRSVFATT